MTFMIVFASTSLYIDVKVILLCFPNDIISQEI